MIVIADTGPLNYLILLGMDELLRDLYVRVLVPRAVAEEMMRPKAPAPVRAWAIAPPAWVEIISVVEIDPTLNPELGAGEQEAISLALALKADVLLLDDRTAREEASARHLAVTGTVAVLIAGALRGRCDLRASLLELRRLGFRMSVVLEAGAIERFERHQSHKP